MPSTTSSPPSPPTSQPQILKLGRFFNPKSKLKSYPFFYCLHLIFRIYRSSGLVLVALSKSPSFYLSLLKSRGIDANLWGFDLPLVLNSSSWWNLIDFMAGFGFWIVIRIRSGGKIEFCGQGVMRKLSRRDLFMCLRMWRILRSYCLWFLILEKVFFFFFFSSLPSLFWFICLRVWFSLIWFELADAYIVISWLQVLLAMERLVLLLLLTQYVILLK